MLHSPSARIGARLQLGCLVSLAILLGACGGGAGRAAAASGAPTTSMSSASSATSSAAHSSAVSSFPSSSASSSLHGSSTSPSSSSAASANTGLTYRGVTLAGAEFGADVWGSGALPGTYGTHYTYPTQAEVDYFVSKKMNVIRLPFRWERLQPALNSAFDSTELGRLDAFVVAATAKGANVVLDPHNYARWHTNVIGSSAVPNSAFADFWGRLATRYKTNPRVILALMNEPHDMTTESWLAAANAAIAAIRNAGASNLVLVPGNGWTGAASWSQNWYGTANATAMQGVVDAGNNHAFEVHQYLDGDSSGTAANCVSTTIGAERLAGFTNWLRAHGKRGFLGEFAGGNNATCQSAVSGALTHLNTNQDVWIGWTWWAAGPWWNDYMFTLEPASGTDAPQMSWLAPYLP